MIKKMREMILGRDYELRERIFRVIILVGCLLATMGIVESFALMDWHIIVIPLFLLLTVMIVELLATFKYRKIEFSATLLGVILVVIVFPQMFFQSGGLDGGATIWFVLGLFYVFLMFSGKKMIFFVILSLAVDLCTYYLGYSVPERIHPMNSRGIAFVDSYFSMLLVGIAGGIILKVQMKVFDIERDVAKKQQEELERISNSKNTFFASMSHEIRTPINTIVGLNELILRESEEDTVKEYALNIQNASKMLLNLVNDILDLSQLEVKKMEIVPTKYRTEELFTNLIDMIQVRLKEKKLDFYVDIDEKIPSVLYGDIKRINQVILNILTNAAKYTETGSVTLSAHIQEQDGADIVLKISVADTGIGIRKEDLLHLYDSFHRVDAEKNQKIEGSGLGLAITKQLVDMMGGELTVDSIYRKGSVFTIILPQKIEDSVPIGDVKFLSRSRGALVKYQQSFEAPEARVLIVDDNEMNSMVATKLLEGTKVQVDTASSGKQCLEMTKTKYYHVILMDYMMPEMDGGETLKEVRRQENGLCRDSAVIVLSANSISEAGTLYMEQGFDGFLEKPIDAAALEAEVLRFIPEDIIEFQLDEHEWDEESEIQKISHHKKKKLHITTDCVSDLPTELLERYDIGMMYLYIRTPNGRFADTLEIDSDGLNQFLADNEFSAVADSVSVEEYEKFFSEMLTEAEQVVHISKSSNVGESYAAAVTAAQGFDHVHVIDSEQVSCGQALVVLHAAKLAMDGCGLEELCEKLERVKDQIEARFILPRAGLYYRNGYAREAFSKVVDFFQLHPVLKMNKGKFQIIGVRGGKLENAWKRFVHWHLIRKRKIDKDILFFSHIGCNVRQQELLVHEAQRYIPFRQVLIHRCSVTVACSAGLHAIGLAYYKKGD